MTAYGDRRRAGHYDVGSIQTVKQDTVYDPQGGGTTVQEPPAPAPEPGVEPDTELTLKELQAQAEALGLPTYGTKAQLTERIANAG